MTEEEKEFYNKIQGYLKLFGQDYSQGQEGLFLHKDIQHPDPSHPVTFTSISLGFKVNTGETIWGLPVVYKEPQPLEEVLASEIRIDPTELQDNINQQWNW